MKANSLKQRCLALRCKMIQLMYGANLLRGSLIHVEYWTIVHKQLTLHLENFDDIVVYFAGLVVKK